MDLVDRGNSVTDLKVQSEVQTVISEDRTDDIPPIEQ
jgi:hypothetical protein